MSAGRLLQQAWRQDAAKLCACGHHPSQHREHGYTWRVNDDGFFCGGVGCSCRVRYDAA